MSTPAKPNFIVVVSDTFRRDHVDWYVKDEGGQRSAVGSQQSVVSGQWSVVSGQPSASGISPQHWGGGGADPKAVPTDARMGERRRPNAEGRTPNLDRLAAESVVFDQAYACSFPTLPCRAELFTGKFVFPFLRWGPLPADEITLAQRLGEARYHTAVIGDNLPFFRPGYGYDRGFQTRIHLRGQWYDRWADPSIPVTLPAPETKLDLHDRVRQYLRNVAGREREEDYFAPQVMRTAVEWLERFARRGPFYLHVECFDPHEPWDPPASYVDPARVGEERIIYPRLGRASEYDERDLQSIRELYAGEVRMVDRWMRYLLDGIDALGLRENTVLVFLSDHGIFLGEHGLIGKAGKHPADVDGWPPYQEVSRIPLMVRMPGSAHRSLSAFVHPGDLMPTFLDLASIPIPAEVRASSLLPLIRGDADRLREIAVTAWSYRGWRSHHPTCIRNEEWSMIWWRTGIPPRLHHLKTDPGEERDVFQENRPVARALHSSYVGFLKQQPCRARNYWSRRFFLFPGLGAGCPPGASRPPVSAAGRAGETPALPGS